MSFLTGTQAELLYSLSAPVTKNTYTTEAAFTGVAGTNTVCKLPAGYFLNDNPNPVGRSLYLVVRGTIATTAAATFAVNFGVDTTAGTKANSTTVYAATAPTAAVTAPWKFEAELTCAAFATSTFSLQVDGTWTQEAAAAGAALNATAWSASATSLLTGIDPRVDLYLELFGTWSASAGGNTTTVNQFKLFGQN